MTTAYRTSECTHEYRRDDAGIACAKCSYLVLNAKELAACGYITRQRQWTHRHRFFARAAILVLSALVFGSLFDSASVHAFASAHSGLCTVANIFFVIGWVASTIATCGDACVALESRRWNKEIE